MKQPSRVPHLLRRVLVSLVVAAVLITSVAAGQPAQRTDQPVNAQAAAMLDFQQRLEKYLALRTELSKKLTPLTPTASATDLVARQESLANAIRAARATARPGDLVPPLVADQIKQAILDDFKRRSAADERATFSEVPNAPRPTINRTYPMDAALPTVPPLLLLNLPRLPDNLQYRFYGRHVLLLDGDVQIIVDYIANVLPPR
jgi:hypothetical protein